MHVCKGGQISEVGAKFPRKYGPRGGQIFGGAKFPVTSVGSMQNDDNLGRRSKIYCIEM